MSYNIPQTLLDPFWEASKFHYRHSLFTMCYGQFLMLLYSEKLAALNTVIKVHTTHGRENCSIKI